LQPEKLSFIRREPSENVLTYSAFQAGYAGSIPVTRSDENFEGATFSGMFA